MKIKKEMQKIFSDFFQKMGLPVDIEALEVEEGIRVNIKPLDQKFSSLLIGYRGENLLALQHMLRMVARKKIGQAVKIVLDIDNYRRRQEEGLKEMVLGIAERVKRTSRVELLRPMTAFERRIVHLGVKEFGQGLATQSVGEEPNRRVLIKLASSEE